MDISVIVPIYNVAEYLSECLESLADQSGVSIEAILVDDGSTDNSGVIAERFARSHEGFTCFHRPNKGLGDARNFGIAQAHGDYLAFLDSDDMLAPNVYATMHQIALRDKSEIVTCNVARVSSRETAPSSLHRRAFDDIPAKTNLRESPQLVYDTTSWNKLYLRSFFLESGIRFPTKMLYEDIPVTIPLYCMAESVSTLPVIGYYWRIREGMNKSITQRNDALRNVHDRLEAMRMLDDFLNRTDQPEKVRRTWQGKALEIDLMIFVNQLPELDDETAERFAQLLCSYIDERIDERLIDGLPFIKREKIKRLIRRDYGSLAQIASRQDRFYSAPVVEEGARLIAQLPEPPFETGRVDITDETFSLGTRCVLSNASANRDGIKLVGAVYWERVNMPLGAQRHTACLVHEASGKKLPVPVQCHELKWMGSAIGSITDADTGETHRYDCSGFGFSLRIGKAELADERLARGTWHVYIEYENRFRSGRVMLANPRGLATNRRGGASLLGDTLVRLDYTRARQVELEVVHPNAIVESVERKGERVVLRTNLKDGRLLLVPSKTPPSAELEGSVKTNGAIELQSDGAGRHWYLPASLKPHAEYTLYAIGRGGGQTEAVPCSRQLVKVYRCAGGAIVLCSLQTRLLRCVRRHPAPAVMTDAQVGPSELIARIRLKDKAARTKAERVELGFYDKRLSEFRVLAKGVRESGSAPGEFSFLVDFSDAALTRDLYRGTRGLKVRYEIGDTGAASVVPLYSRTALNCRFERATIGIRIRRNGKGTVELKSLRRQPADLDAASRYNAGTLELYRRYRSEPLNERLVLFESMWGKGFNCNPRALYDYIDRRYPQYECVWALADEHTPITGRAKRIPKGSPEYFHCLATAKYLVDNVNFPAQYVKREGQVNIQTMHGTPVKTLGLEVPGDFKTKASLEEYRKKLARYDYLIVQGSFMASKAFDIFAFDKTILKTGYPRTDRLFGATRADADGIRRKLGIPEGKRVVLYAPTWRERNRFDMRIDLADFKNRFGSEWTILVRMHHLAAAGYRVPADHDVIFDCSRYEPVEDLYIASDALITDYSSAMFDFALTGKPILLFAYDLEEYRDHIRGMYIDLEKEAPGPLLYTHEQLMEALSRIDTILPAYRERIKRFMSTYLTYESPRSCAAVVNKVMKPSPLETIASRLKLWRENVCGGRDRP